MELKDKMRNLFGKGVEVSKDAITKASSTAKDLGGKGKLYLEIHRLESTMKEQFVELGRITYDIFSEDEHASINQNSNARIMNIIETINSLHQSIINKEQHIKKNAQEPTTTHTNDDAEEASFQYTEKK